MTARTFILAEKWSQVEKVCRARRINPRGACVHIFTNATAEHLRGYRISDDDILIVEGTLSDELMDNYAKADWSGRKTQ